jgi:hypothetical protein
MKLIDKSRKSHVVASSPNADEQPDEKKHLTVEQVPGEDQDLTLARVRLHPVLHAAATMLSFDKPLNDHKLTSIAQELGQHEKDVKAGSMGRAESILINQANTLDVIFNSLAQRAGANVGANADLAERYLRMALKAQSQCRTTIEALAEIKSPRSATFIKQQNIAEQQQVNNGPTVNGVAGHARAHEKKTEVPPNELLEACHGERLDKGATGEAIGTDPQLETVGTVDRPKKRSRKNAQ